jgi:hypothetical protein
VDWEGVDAAEGDEVGAEGGEVRGVVEGEVGFYAVPVF